MIFQLLRTAYCIGKPACYVHRSIGLNVKACLQLFPKPAILFPNRRLCFCFGRFYCRKRRLCIQKQAILFPFQAILFLFHAILFPKQPILFPFRATLLLFQGYSVSETSDLVSRNKIACFGNKCGQAFICFRSASSVQQKLVDTGDLW